jgi:hypothetical protein
MDQKLPPYQRLKNILNEGEKPSLTIKASKNLDEILGIQPKEKNLLDKFFDIFKKIDRKIFSEPSRKWNTNYHKRQL